MLKVGITGGIGSGKTTVCKIFETLGIPVYYADDRAKWLMVNKPKVREAIESLFGLEAFQDGQLNRAWIAKKAFSQPELLEKLNGIVHPAVAKDTLEWQEAQSKVPYTLKEAALIFESNSHKRLDKVITVTAPVAVRIQRVMQRDGLSESEIQKRIAKQIPDEEKIKQSDYVIQNDGQHSLIHQVLSIHKALIAANDLFTPSQSK